MKISVVTPSFNQGEFLGETLGSVRLAAARVPDHEVEHLVIDGGSTDSTLAVLKAQDFARWSSEPDNGQADAINRGWKQSTGEILTFLCSDDLWEPDALERVLAVFQRDPLTEVVYGDYYFLEGASGWKRRKTAGPWSRERLLRGNFISQPATFWRRSVYERHGGLDTSLRYCLDHEYWLRISLDTQWVYVPEPLALMRLHGGAKTGSGISAMWWESARMQRRYHHSLRPWIAAMHMAVIGQHYYRMKRRFFEWLGMRRQAR